MRLRTIIVVSAGLLAFLSPLGSSPALAAGSTSPSWISGACEQDGNLASLTAACQVPAGYKDTTTASPSDKCAGAVLCGASWAQLQAAGFDTSGMQAESAAITNSFTSAKTAGLSVTSLGMPTNWTGQYGWNDFYLYPADSSCNGTKTYNNHCAWLYNHVIPFANGIPKPTQTYTFPARSGDNSPTNSWVVDQGPVPKGDWGSSSPTLGNFHWGWHGGVKVGFIKDTSDTYFPGKFPLDPWDVWLGSGRTGTHRNAFEIHGGINLHDFWTTVTQGCIRLPHDSVTGLKYQWVNLADNKSWSPGPDNTVRYVKP